MKNIEPKEKSITTQIIEEFIASLKDNEEFNEKMILDLTTLSNKKQLGNENLVEKIITPEN